MSKKKSKKKTTSSKRRLLDSFCEPPLSMSWGCERYRRKGDTWVKVVMVDGEWVNYVRKDGKWVKEETEEESTGGSTHPR
jgi:hypothetical protein